MKGVIFNAFEAFISGGYGDEAYEALLQMCPKHMQDGVYVGPETYPDEELVTMLTKACERFDLEPEDALRGFGRFLFGVLSSRFGKFLTPHNAPKSFLMSVHDVVHVEVRKLFKDAVTPSFLYKDTGPDTLDMHYTSPRRLCFLMEGLLDGLGEHYNVAIEHQQTACMHKGAEACAFHLHFGEPTTTETRAQENLVAG